MGRDANASIEPPDAVVRLVATLETSLGKLVDGQRVVRDELRALGGRVDSLAGKIELLAARVDELAARVHRSNNIMVSLVDETSALAEAQHTLDRALEFVETQQKAKLLELERAHRAIERAVEFVESRVRHVRDAVADVRERMTDEQEAEGGERR